MFPPIKDMEPEREWLFCDVAEGKFRGRGGPPMLGRILRVFLDWARREDSAAAAIGRLRGHR